MYYHNSLIPRRAFFLLPLVTKQEATSGWNLTECILKVKVNQLEENTHVRMVTPPFFKVTRRYNKKVKWSSSMVEVWKELWKLATHAHSKIFPRRPPHYARSYAFFSICQYCTSSILALSPRMTMIDKITKPAPERVFIIHNCVN